LFRRDVPPIIESEKGFFTSSRVKPLPVANFRKMLMKIIERTAITNRLAVERASSMMIYF
jgi:hypothetical protein